MSFARLRASLSPTAPAYLALACFGLAAPATAQTADAGSKPTKLGGMTVTDTAIDDSIKVDHVSSPKFTQPLIDTPQTIQVIDKELFNQQGATSLAEALRNSPGVGTFYAGENGNTSTGDAIYMRGFDTSNSIFVDGIRDLGAVSRDIFNTEQVEVEKGPAGTDNGRTAPTGAINMVTKQPSMETAVSAIVTGGTDGQKRATADFNQGLGFVPNAAFRLNLMWQDYDVAGRDHVKNKRIGVAPALGFGLGTSTRAYLDFTYIYQDNVPDGFVPTLGLPGWDPQPGLTQLAGHPVDPENFYGTRDDLEHVTAKMATFKLEHDFSSAVKLQNIARWGETRQKYLITSFMSTGGTVAAPLAGNIKYTDPADLDTYTLARSNPNLRNAKNIIATDQLNLRADFATGPVKHNLTGGVEFAHEVYDNYGVTTTGSRPAASLYDPDWNDEGTLAIIKTGAGSRGETNTLSAYLFDTAKLFDDHLLVTGGVRVDRYKTSYFANAVCGGTARGAVACGTAPTGSILTTADLSTKNTLFNWKIGGVFKPAAPVSIYINYALSQQPPGGANFTLSTSTTSADNPDLDPQKAKTLEAGVKWSVLHDALTLSAAWFRTEVTNEINSQLLDDSGNPTQTGKKRVKGIELFAVGHITDAWSLSAGYSHLDTKVTEGAAVASDGSPNLTYTPGDSFTSWTSYRFPFGLELAGGVRHNGGLHRGTDGAVGTPAYTRSYTVVDALIAYQLTDWVKLRLNAYNLANKQYVTAINKSGYRYTPGIPRTFLFSADFNF